jgi:threonylcarbamoyladenosine tRNA methylthiotransferase MtaB
LRFRLSSIEIGDVTDSLIALMAGSAKICRHLHIPLQSGDDAVLKRMRRRYCVADYLSLAAKIKKAIPGIAITTDVLVGFPAENAQAFQNSVKAVKKILPLRTHVFTYSPREHTAASREFPKGLGREESKRRADYLKVIAGQCSIKFRQGLLGQVFPVLLEGRWQKNPAFWRGYTDNYVLAAVKSPRLLKNRLLPLELKQIYGDCVLAR